LHRRDPPIRPEWWWPALPLNCRASKTISFGRRLAGNHFGQVDGPDEIGAAIADWMQASMLKMRAVALT
jgi:hypothetical protein